MRDVVQTTTCELPAPSARQRSEARDGGRTAQDHARLASSWPCLNAIEQVAPPRPAALPGALTVAAWNIERCRQVEASADLLRRVGADVVLATELDRGMARSGQRHTCRDLARALGMGFAYGVEFVELGTGDVRETAVFGDEANAEGLHGNAILARWPLRDAAVIRLDDGGAWFVRAPKGDGQFRVGARNAVAARIDTVRGPLLLVAVHLESESDAAGRAAQIGRLVLALDRLYGRGPAVIGGDLNTAGFLASGLNGAAMLEDPAAVEPCFGVLAAHGFEWRGANTGRTTTRRPPWARTDGPLKTLDWLFVRGAEASAPDVVPALSEAGEYLSDHEMVTARIAP